MADSPLANSPQSNDNLYQEKNYFSLEKFYFQMQAIPFLVQQALVIDHVLATHFQELQDTAEKIIHYFKGEKQKILSGYDQWLMPVADEVLEELLQDARQLKDELDETIKCIKKTSEMNWPQHLKNWEDLYAKWNNRDEINKKILILLSEKTTYLIEKDVRVIKDYQIQTLSRVTEGEQEYRNLEKRLVKATAAPLKQLLELKIIIDRNSTLKQASDWASHLREQRESYFNNVLMKIDSIARDLVQPEEEMVGDELRELENEMNFVEDELKNIYSLISNLRKEDDEGFLFLENRLEGLKDHLEQYLSLSIPAHLKKRIDKLFQSIDTCFLDLEHNKFN